MSQPFQPEITGRRFDIQGNRSIDDLLGGLEGRIDRVTLPPEGREDIVITDECTQGTCLTCNSCATCNTCTCTCLFCEGIGADPRNLSGW
jgi:hypothetical protein